MAGKVPMTRTIPAFVARTQFGQIMAMAQKARTRFLVSKNGEPAVVILGVRDYLENVVKQPEALAELQTEARKRGLDRLTPQDIEAEIRAYRSEKRKKSRG